MASERPNAELGFRALLWHWLRRPGWSVVAPVLLTAFTGVFAWQIFFSQSELEKGLAALNAIHRTARPLEARISGLGYVPYDNGNVKFDEQKFKMAEDFLVVQIRPLSTPAARHARGKFHLVTNKPEEAFREFEAALKLDPNNAQLHNDLGVAWLEKATRERTSPEASQHFAQSRAHLEQALQHDRRNLEALFNLALLDFRQGLWKQSEESWQLYLKNDERSGWAQEAKTYLNRIKALQQQTNNSTV